MRIEEKYISTERVRKFLELTQDDNSIHQNPYNILPGMFYLALSAPYMEKSIKSLDLKFRDKIKYPCEIDLEIEDYKGGEKFLFKSLEGNLICEAKFSYNENPSDNDKKKNLEEFSYLLGVETKNPNIEKIRLASLLPKRLLNFFKSEGFYLQQKLDFKKENSFDYEELFPKFLLFKEIRGIKIIKTDFENALEDIIVEGQSKISPIAKLQ